jgi:hypothetical protein
LHVTKVRLNREIENLKEEMVKQEIKYEKQLDVKDSMIALLSEHHN